MKQDILVVQTSFLHSMGYDILFTFKTDGATSDNTDLTKFAPGTLVQTSVIQGTHLFYYTPAENLYVIKDKKDKRMLIPGDNIVAYAVAYKGNVFAEELTVDDEEILKGILSKRIRPINLQLGGTTAPTATPTVA